MDVADQKWKTYGKAALENCMRYDRWKLITEEEALLRLDPPVLINFCIRPWIQNLQKHNWPRVYLQVQVESVDRSFSPAKKRWNGKRCGKGDSCAHWNIAGRHCGDGGGSGDFNNSWWMTSMRPLWLVEWASVALLVAVKLKWMIAIRPCVQRLCLASGRCDHLRWWNRRSLF